MSEKFIPSSVVVGGVTEPSDRWTAKVRRFLASKRHKALVAALAALLLLAAIGAITAVILPKSSSTDQASKTTTRTGSSGSNQKGTNKSGQPPKQGSSGQSAAPSTTTQSPAKNAAPGGQNTGGGSNGTGNGATTGGGATSTSYPYPARWSVGAPGVAHYNQTQASLPVPAGYTEVSGNGTPGEWDIYDCSSPVVYDHYYFHTFIYIGTGCSGSITIKNSIIAPPPGTTQRTILNNSNGGVTLTIQDTTIRPEPVPLGGTNAALTDHIVNNCGSTCHVTLTRLDVSNSGGMCLCGENTLVQNSWLHDSYIAHLSDPSVAHTGGVFPYGGSGPVEVSHNRLEPGFNVGTGSEVTNYWKAITAVLFTQSSGGTQLQNYYVHDNFISLGAFDMDLEDGLGIVVTNNVFGPSHWGSTSTCSSGCTVTYSNWSGNVLGDINGIPNTTVVNHP